MNESNNTNPGDLASLLWEKQGRPQGQTDANWLEAEERRLQAFHHRPDENSEIELRSRGLGPIDHPSRSDVPPQSVVGVREASRVKLLLLLAFGAVVVLFSWRKLRK